MPWIIVLQYLSLTYVLASTMMLLPITRAKKPTLAIHLVLCALNAIAVFFTVHLGAIAIISVIAVTALFTKGADVVGRYIVKNFVRLIKSKSILLKIKYLLTLNRLDYGLQIFSQAWDAFEKGDIREGERIIFDYTRRTKNDPLWINNCLFFLTEIGHRNIAYALLKSVPDILSSPQLPYLLFNTAIPVLCAEEDFDLAEQYLEYLETHYNDIQHQTVIIQAYLTYFSFLGDEKSFNDVIDASPQIQKQLKLSPLAAAAYDRAKSTPLAATRHIKKPRLPQSIPTEQAPRHNFFQYVFAGIIGVASLLQFYFSEGGTLLTRLLWGNMYAAEYLRLGATSRTILANNEWIRLVTHIFLHAGVLHLGLNLFGLVILARVLRHFFDNFIILFIFFGGAITGGILQIHLGASPLAVGASGGVFALLGALLMHTVWHRRRFNRTALRKFFIGMAIVAAAEFGMSLQVDNIGHWAHIGGFLGGAALTAFVLSIGTGTVYKSVKLFTRVALILLVALLMAYWPPLLRKNPFDSIELNTTISKLNVETRIPAEWVNESDRYFDVWSGSEVIFSVMNSDHLIHDEVDAIKKAYNDSGQFRFSRAEVLKEGWRLLTFTPTMTLDSSALPDLYSLYIFCKKDTGKLITFTVFAVPSLENEYIPFFYRILFATTRTR